MLPLADELGVTPWLAVPEANGAERQKARLASGASLRETPVYTESVVGTLAYLAAELALAASGVAAVPSANAPVATPLGGITSVA